MHPRYVLKRKKKERKRAGRWVFVRDVGNISSAQAFHSLTECQQKVDSRKSVLVQFLSEAGLVCV